MIVGIITGVDLIIKAGRGEDIFMGQHSAFGQAGCAGGVAEHG